MNHKEVFNNLPLLHCRHDLMSRTVNRNKNISSHCLSFSSFQSQLFFCFGDVASKSFFWQLREHTWHWEGAGIHISGRLLNTSLWLVNSSLTLDSFCQFCCTGFLWKGHYPFFSAPMTKRKKSGHTRLTHTHGHHIISFITLVCSYKWQIHLKQFNSYSLDFFNAQLLN